MHSQFGFSVFDVDAPSDNVAAFIDAFNTFDKISSTTDTGRAIANASAGNGTRICRFLNARIELKDISAIVNLGQLQRLLNDRLRCAYCTAFVKVKSTYAVGLATYLELTCDNCKRLEIWNADETEVTFEMSKQQTTGAISTRAVFAMFVVGLGMAGCNLILQTLNIKVRLYVII